MNRSNGNNGTMETTGSWFRLAKVDARNYITVAAYHITIRNHLSHK